MDHFSERRMVENELMFRAANRKVQKHVQNAETKRSGPDGTKLHFYCECSNLHCRDRILLTVGEYRSASSGKKEFIVLPGHENKAVERVVKETEKFNVVEKYMDPSRVLKNIP